MDTPEGSVVGAYVLIDTHPTEPYTSETVLNAEQHPPDQAPSHWNYWLLRSLAQQRYTYVVLAQPLSGEVYLNRKIDLDATAVASLGDIALKLARLQPRPWADPSVVQRSSQYFMDHSSLDVIQF